jgi:hypothetical protein
VLAVAAPVIVAAGDIELSATPASTEEGRFSCRLPVADESDADGISKTPLVVCVTQNPCGVEVEALGDGGTPLGSACLDFFDNGLRALIFDGDDEQPAVYRTLADDVDSARAAVPEAAGRG